MSRMAMFLMVGLAFTCESFGQSNTLVAFDSSFALLSPQTKVPSGRKIMLKGHTPKDVVSIVITVITNAEQKDVQAFVSDSIWTAIVGPFSPNQTVFLQFKVVSQLPDSAIKIYVARILNSMVLDIFANFPGSVSPGKFSDYVTARLSKLAASDNLREFKTSDGKSIYAIISEGIKSIGRDSIRSLINLVNLVQSIREDSSSLGETVDSFKRDCLSQVVSGLNKVDTSNLSSNSAIEALVKNYKARNNPADSIGVRMVKLMSGLRKSLDSEKASFDGSVSRMTDLVVAPLQMEKNFEIPEDFTSILDVSDLEKYADIDVGGLLVSNIAVVPVLAINPYLNTLFSSSSPLLDILSFGIGIGLSTKGVDAKSPPYSFGVSARLNRIFRIAVGPLFYVPNGGGKLMWRFGFSTSINFRYLGDLLNVFSSVSSSMQSSTQ